MASVYKVGMPAGEPDPAGHALAEAIRCAHEQGYDIVETSGAVDITTDGHRANGELLYQVTVRQTTRD